MYDIKEGDIVSVNVACPFECKSKPKWKESIVLEVHDTHFVIGHNDSVVKRFYAHVGETWRI